MTIGEACAHFGVTDKTIRRWIKTKRVDARKNAAGRWSIQVGHDQPDTARTDAHPPDHALIDHMRSENDHLRQQVDRLTSLLAVTTQQNSALTNQLPPPRTPILTRLKALFGSQA